MYFLSFYFPPLSSFPLSEQIVAITQGGAIQLANNGTDGVQGLQTLTMTNAAAAAQPGATILQYAQTSDGQQILVPSNQVVVQGKSGSLLSMSTAILRAILLSLAAKTKTFGCSSLVNMIVKQLTRFIKRPN